jgi:hypothetical protein
MALLAERLGYVQVPEPVRFTEHDIELEADG